MKKVFLMVSFIVFTILARITVVELDGTVDNGMAYLLNRSLENRTSEDTLIYRVNTYGGYLFSAFDMADSVFRSDAHTIAFVDQKAISAGALISIACNEIVMGEGSTIGDCAPVQQGEDGPLILNEKIQSPLRAKFRLFADKNEYPRYLAAAMVSPDLKIYKITTKDTVFFTDLIHDAPDVKGKADTVVMVDEGELLTLTEEEALETGFSSGTYDDFEAFSDSIGIPATAEIISRNWSENFVAFIGKIAPILMMIGMAGIYIETRSPGIGAPGIIGAICLLFAYTGQHMAGLANYVELLLLGIGLLLLAAEIFVIPGFGIAGILGILFIACSAVLSLQNFTLPSPDLPFQADIFKQNLQKMGLSLLGSMVLIILFFWQVFPRLKVISNGPILSKTLEETHKEESMNGTEGVVSKDLHPAGKIEIAGISYDAISEGFLLEKGENVVVIGKKGGSLLVRKVQA